MSEREGFKRHIAIFTYDLSKLNNVNKVKLVYLLKGRRDGSGLVKELSGEFLVPGCFKVPSEKSSEVERLFRSWKVVYQKEEVLMH
jgi:hypothetical protein